MQRDSKKYGRVGGRDRGWGRETRDEAGGYRAGVGGRDEWGKTLGKTGGRLRERVVLQLGMLDLIYEKCYYNETRDGDCDDDPSKGTSIREYAVGSGKYV
jgi:hypothetical protein